ncbi:MAG: extracellular solute-binding protein [Coprobacillus sp.]
MNKKKVIAFGLSLVLILTAFSGCGKPKENAKANELKAGLDFGGKEIKLVYPPGYDMLNTDGKNAVLVKRDAKIKETAQKYNCTVKQKEGKGNYWDVMANSIAAGAPEGHVMVTQANRLVDWVNAGAIADLAPAMAETGIDFTDPKYAQVTRKYSNFNGKQYGFTDATPYPSGEILVFNKRIFNEMQLEDPYQLMKDKKWTWDKVHELATKATKRTPDGNVTQWGFGSWMHMAFLLTFANSNGGGISNFNAETGEPELTLTKPESQKAFELMYQWTSKEKIARVNNGSQSWDTVMTEFIAGNIAILESTPKVLQFAQEKVMKDDYGVAYLPMGPDVKEYTGNIVLAETYFIPVTYQDMTTQLILFMDETFTLPEGEDLKQRIAERNMPRLRDTESLEVLTDMTLNNKNYIFDIYNMTGLDWTSPSIADICVAVMNGKSTPSEEIEKNKDKFVISMKDKMAGLKFTGK